MDGRAVFIAGMPRSGTSGLCGALAKLGVYFGAPELLYAADKHNEEGYWEHKQLNAAVRKFHLSLNLAGLDLDPMPSDWRERPLSEHMTGAVQEILHKSFDGSSMWGWKDPQASSLLPFVLEIFKCLQVTPTLAICVRNPLDVAQSHGVRHGTPETQTLSSWLLATLSALKHSRGMRRSIVLYEDLLLDPRTALEPIMSNLELEPSSEQWQAAIQSVRPDLSHGQKRPTELPPFFQAVYGLCESAAAAPERLNEGDLDAEIDDLWSQWLRWHDLFSRPPLPAATFGASWERGGQTHVLENSYLPSRTWQLLRSPCGALPGGRVSLWIYPLPALVWIRRAVWRKVGVELEAELLPGANGQLDEQAGVKRVWLYSGREQVATTAPAASGKFELELEVLIETSNVITGMTFQELSKGEERRGKS